MMPACGGLLGPVVRGQQHGLIEPLAITGHDLFPKPSEADDANARFRGNGDFQVGQIDGSHVAENSSAAHSTEAGEAGLDDPLLRQPTRQAR